MGVPVGFGCGRRIATTAIVVDRSTAFPRNLGIF
jgi:hypothetical protein